MIFLHCISACWVGTKCGAGRDCGTRTSLNSSLNVLLCATFSTVPACFMLLDWLDCCSLNCFILSLLNNCLQCLAVLVGCQEEHSACKKLSDEVPVHRCLSVQMISCIWFSWWHCHPIISCFVKIHIGLTCQLTHLSWKRGCYMGVCLLFLVAGCKLMA